MRGYASAEPDLKETFKRVLPTKRELLKKVKAHGDKKLGDVKVENTLGGMRFVLLAMSFSGDIRSSFQMQNSSGVLVCINNC